MSKCTFTFNGKDDVACGFQPTLRRSVDADTFSPHARTHVCRHGVSVASTIRISHVAQSRGVYGLHSAIVGNESGNSVVYHGTVAISGSFHNYTPHTTGFRRDVEADLGSMAGSMSCDRGISYSLNFDYME